ncbi:unnamed protein product [Closterium sp. Yama58-4]|nr:unnamed protein product [Closterium sp. Yama58-4]
MSNRDSIDSSNAEVLTAVLKLVYFYHLPRESHDCPLPSSPPSLPHPPQCLVMGNRDDIDAMSVGNAECLVMGNPDNIDALSTGNTEVLTAVLKLQNAPTFLPSSTPPPQPIQTHGHPPSFQCLVMGNRDDIDAMSAGNAEVLTTVLKLIDKYDLYGQVAYPKHHKQSEVPDIYALAAKSKVRCL